MKVFSKDLVLPTVSKCWPNNPENYAWIYECDGLTNAEIHQLGYATLEEWFIEQ
jgi:hypothetical protein